MYVPMSSVVHIAFHFTTDSASYRNKLSNPLPPPMLVLKKQLKPQRRRRTIAPSKRTRLRLTDCEPSYRRLRTSLERQSRSLNGKGRHWTS
jgi:hypothetical protein